VLAYLSRYTHRIAIANSRLVAFDGERVTFKWKAVQTSKTANLCPNVVYRAKLGQQGSGRIFQLIWKTI
jgi:hypothetical protein